MEAVATATATASGGAGNSSCSFMTCEKLDRAANWVGASVASAFFASLERCSCITLNTADPDEDDSAGDGPLILSNLPPSSSVHDPRPA